MGGEEEVAAERGGEEVAAEISPLTEVAAAVGDELFGPTSERGVDEDGGRR